MPASRQVNTGAIERSPAVADPTRFSLLAIQDGFDAVNQGRTRKRLFKQTDGSRLQGPGSDALIRERRDKNERRVIAASANLRQKVQAAYAGHLHIRNDERGVFQSSRPKEIFR